MNNKIEVEGRITDIIFYNRENGYIVAVFETEAEMFTIVGNVHEAMEGRSYLLRGQFIEHKKYGEQFAFFEYEEKMPETEEGIESFLCSGVIKGIGPKMAKAIVSRFGTATLDIIAQEPERLTEVSGIGERKADVIAEAFSKHKAFAEIVMFLQKYGIKADFAMRLYKVYGEKTIEAIEENPYRLVEDIFGIGFKKADEIASKLGVEKEDEFRIKSGIKFVLWNYANQGHSFVPQVELAERTGELLDVSLENINDTMVQMAFEGSIQIEKLEERNVVFLLPYYLAEQSVTRRIMEICNGDLKPLCIEIDNLINQTEVELGISFSQEQKKAVRNCLNNGISVITGGPGTGKTTIINGIINILKCGDFKIAVAAPTGRAAKRITETTGHEASTIHRLLEYYFSEGEGVMRFGKDEQEKLDYDAIIIDEASMVDILLMDGLLKAIQPGTRLIIVGDADQLPSVGVGNVLGDIIDSEYIHCEKLTEIFRQAKESMIVVNAHRINKGEYPFCNEKDKDFFFMAKNSERDMMSLILQLCEKRLPQYYQLDDRVQDIQVLTPTRKGMMGSVNLNTELQKVLNPASDELEEKEFGGRIFRERDKVMQIRNNYDLQWRKASDMSQGQGVFNGDIGVIRKIDKDENKITVVFDGDKFVTYEFAQLDELELAYAMTVHKSQGSEFPVVVMPMTWVAPTLANRNLLYTGVTRGKKVVVLVGSERQMMAMIDNNSIKKRNSGLAIRIRNYQW